MTLQNIFVVLGPPGSGKGTQSELLAKKTEYEHISVGDLIRAFIKGQSKEAIESKERYDKGIPQPDNIASMLLREKLKSINEIGAVFDTYPLSIGQAQDLSKIVEEISIKNLKVIFLNVDVNEVVKRISERKICSKCKTVFLPIKPGYDTNVCSECGGDLIMRSDDKPEIARGRFIEYEKRNIPIKEYYSERGLLVEINGDQSIEDVHKEVLRKLNM